MPQIAQIGEIFASQLFWLAIFFGAIFAVVGLGMLPKIQSTVDARDAKIAADLKAAEGAREAADALEEAYRAEMDKSRAEAARLSAEAKANAARATEQSVNTADAAMGRKIDAAMVRIGEARASAMAEIETVAAEAAEQLVSRVAGLTVEPATARAAVAKELAHG
ncbi:ATPase [Sphingomonas sp. LY160]|uniref:F0F1 ATP synthase subunit B family protein n=1 Tax=Sphingomonas sp. LY160 TaxID=3095342 RepID=UPI002ADEA900|nr:ATPase [Sphingomonas sp. LY160]MEA1071605.1 ATPase [Sphingomonas sp. LY160]